METSIQILLEKIIKEGYTPTPEELGMIREIKQDINDFADHWDESKEKPTPFLYINMLNKMSSKEYVYEGVDLAKLSSLLKKIHGKRYGFTADFLDKDSEGHFVACNDSTDGPRYYPIEMSLSGFLDAFIDKLFIYKKYLQNLSI